MTEIFFWLMRWSIAGVAVSLLVLLPAGFMFWLKRRSGPRLYRTAIMVCLLAPLVALMPPLLHVDAPQIESSNRNSPPIPADLPEISTDLVQPSDAAKQVAVAPQASAAVDWWAVAAGVVVTLWCVGAITALVMQARAYLRLHRAYARGASTPAMGDAPPFIKPWPVEQLSRQVTLQHASSYRPI